jgi:hypothetical protein
LVCLLKIVTVRIQRGSWMLIITKNTWISAVNGQEPQTYKILKSYGSKSNYHTIAFIVPLGYLLILIKQLYIVINSGSISLKSICFRASKDPKQSTTSACNSRTNKQSFNLSDYIYSDWYVLVYSQDQWTATTYLWLFLRHL